MTCTRRTMAPTNMDSYFPIGINLNIIFQTETRMGFKKLRLLVISNTRTYRQAFVLFRDTNCSTYDIFHIFSDLNSAKYRISLAEKQHKRIIVSMQTGRSLL